MSNHKTLSPSKADRWMNCPGSIRMEAGYPDKSSPAAEDGTRTHYLLEQYLKTGKPPIIGMEYMFDGPLRFMHDEERHERVMFAAGYVHDRIVELDKEFGADTTLKSESFVESILAFGRDDLGGTVDVQLINGDFLELIDLKDGMNPVSAENNNQLSIYAINLIFSLMMQNINIQRVRLTIVQPKLRFNGESGIDSWDTTTAHLTSLIPDIIEKAKATKQPDAPLIPGEKQCKYCKHRGACTALNSYVLESSGISFDNLTDLPTQIVAVEEQEHISNERLRDVIQAAPLMRSMLDALEQEALRRFQIGLPVEGLKVIRGRGSKTWKVSADEVADKLAKMGVPKANLWKQVMHTPGQAMKLIWTKKVKGEETEAKLSPRQIKTLESEYIQVNEGSLKVVSENAKGEPVKLVEEGMFKPVELELPDFLK